MNIMNGLRFKAAVLDYRNTVSIIAYLPDASGRIAKIFKPVALAVDEEHQPHMTIANGTLDLKFDEAQNLLDALHEAGMRPTNLANPSGEIARINDHLQDMRRLVFNVNGKSEGAP